MARDDEARRLRELQQRMVEELQRQAQQRMNEYLRKPFYYDGLQNMASQASMYTAAQQQNFSFADAIEQLNALRPNCTVRASEYCIKGGILFADTWAVETWMSRDDPRKAPQYLLLAHPDDLEALGLKPGEISLPQTMVDRLMKRRSNDAGEDQGTP